MRTDSLVILCHISPYLALIDQRPTVAERLLSELTRLALDEHSLSENNYYGGENQFNAKLTSGKFGPDGMGKQRNQDPPLAR